MNALWSRHRTLLSSGAVFVLACLIYANSLGGAFVSDDRPLILDHPHTKSLDQWPGIFRSGHYAGHGGYRPLTTLSFALNYHFHGTDPRFYHLVNVLLHGLVSVLVYLLGVQIFRAPNAALAGALLFAVHPIHTEVVAWISGRAELLAAVFCLGSWLCYLAAGRVPVWRRALLATSLLLFFAGLLSKENALVLPLLIAAGDLYAARGRVPGASRWPAGYWKIYAAFLAVVACYFLLRSALYVEPITRDVARIDFVINPLAAAEAGVRLMTACKVLGEYFMLLVWPAQLSADYSFDAVPVVRRFTDPGFLLSIGIFSALAITALVSFLRRGPLWLPIVLGLVAIGPVSNLLLPVGTIKAERLLYFPSVWFCLAVGLLWSGLRSRVPHAAANTLLLVVVVLCGVRTVQRNADWRSERSLWTAVARTVPQNFRAQHILATDYLRAGDIPRAIEAGSRAVAINPSSAEAVQNLGIALIQGGRPAEAVRLYEQAARTHPQSAAICLNLGLAYAAAGDLRQAVSKLREAVELKPAAVGYLNLGLALSGLGDKESARQSYRRATELDPGYPEAWNALGAVSISLGDPDEAREALHRALQLRPDYREALYNLGLLPDASR